MVSTKSISASHFLIWIWSFFAILMLAGGAAAQNDALEIRLLSEAVFDGRDLLLNLAVQRSSGEKVPGLTEANFRLDEAAENLQVTTQTSLPVSLAVIIDASSGSSLDLIQETLRAFFNQYYQENDSVRFYILGAQEDLDSAREALPSNFSEINSLIDTLPVSENHYSLTNAFDTALSWLKSERAADPSRPVHALFVGSYIYYSREISAAVGFGYDRIPFHGIQAHRQRDNSIADFSELVANAGGIYANNASSSLLAEGKASPGTSLAAIFETVAASRLSYQVRYTTLSQSLSASRTVLLTVDVPGEGSGSASFTYDFVFQAPVVELIAPADILFTRKPDRDAAGEIVYDVAEARLTLRIGFPDGVSRPIESLKLEALNRQTNSVIVTQLENAPLQNEDGSYNLVLPLDRYTSPGETTPVILNISATDPLGNIGKLTLEGAVIVEEAPPLPTPTPLPTPIPTAVPVIIAREALLVEANLARSLTGLVIILAATALILFLSFRIRLKQERARLMRYIANQPDQYDTAAAAQQPLPPAQPEAEIEPEPEETGPLFGRLRVLSGLDEVTEIRLTKEEFVIGRAEDGRCDFIIDKPFISPTHCIFYRRDGKYLVKDLATKNGTFVNQERLPRNREVVVPIGSEIEITHHIRLELWDPDTVFTPTTQTNQAEAQVTQGGGAGLLFRPALKIKYADDTGEPIPDDFAP